jgi:xanthine dehydrogenase small subunit
MSRSLTFILNDRFASTELPAGTVTLDYLRRERRLSGTKEVCREGDCGACAVLLGELPWDSGGAAPGRGPQPVLRYRVVNSCLLPLGELEGRHLVTIEGLNPPGGSAAASAGLPPLNLVQASFLAEGASQCGFCTPGFVISLTGYLLRSPAPTVEGALEAVAGNICRCTGYVSIRRAVARVLEGAGGGGTDRHRLGRLCDLGVLPPYFREVPAKLYQLARGAAPGSVPGAALEGGAVSERAPGTHGAGAGSLALAPEHAGEGEGAAGASEEGTGVVLVAGGTDLFVQRPVELERSRLRFLSRRSELWGVWRDDGRVVIGAATTMEELRTLSAVAATLAPVSEALQWVASSPIRQRATLGGNLVNASPIGDLTILFLALGACLGLRSGARTRELPLEKLYRGYTQLDLRPGEEVAWVALTPPKAGCYVGFEKVARRKHLDIASVNSAAWLLGGAGGEDGDGPGVPAAGHGSSRGVRDGRVEKAARLPRRVIEARLSAGGVAPVPLFLARTSAHLAGKAATPLLFREALELAQTESSPIDDVRGSAAYKRLALRQLLIAHFLRAFPEELEGEDWR